MAYHICPRCGGRGDIKDETNQRVTCPDCLGTGAIASEDEQVVWHPSPLTTSMAAAKLLDTAAVPVTDAPHTSVPRARAPHVLWRWLAIFSSLLLLGLTAFLIVLAVTHGFMNASAQAQSTTQPIPQNGTATSVGQNKLIPTRPAVGATVTPGPALSPTVQSTRTVGTTPTSTPNLAGMPTVAPSPTPTVTSSPTLTPTPTNPSSLQVQPAAITGGLCILGSQSATVSNRGGSVLQWSAFSNTTLITIFPVQGDIPPGKSKTIMITLNSLVANAQITFGGNGGTQVVPVQC